MDCETCIKRLCLAVASSHVDVIKVFKDAAAVRHDLCLVECQQRSVCTVPALSACSSSPAGTACSSTSLYVRTAASPLPTIAYFLTHWYALVPSCFFSSSGRELQPWTTRRNARIDWYSLSLRNVVFVALFANDAANLSSKIRLCSALRFVFRVVSCACCLSFVWQKSQSGEKAVDVARAQSGEWIHYNGCPILQNGCLESHSAEWDAHSVEWDIHHLGSNIPYTTETTLQSYETKRGDKYITYPLASLGP